MKGTKNSLKRLGIDYVDVIYCHRLDLSTPIEETVRAMNCVIDKGWAFIGVLVNGLFSRLLRLGVWLRDWILWVPLLSSLSIIFSPGKRLSWIISIFTTNMVLVLPYGVHLHSAS